jgi:hypothetical protein
MVPVVQYRRLDRLKTWCGSESLPARPRVLVSEEALLRLVGFKAQPGRHGVCQRGAARRPGPRTRGPICPEALADNLVQLHVCEWEAWCTGVIRALTTAGVCAATLTGLVEATARATTAHDEGGGPVTRKRQSTDTRGTVPAIEVTGYGWPLLVLIEAHTTIPWAATVVPIQEPATLGRRALVTQARTNRAGHARRHTGVFARGGWAGVARWWLPQPGLRLVGPAQDHMAVRVEAQAQAAAGEDVPSGRRVPRVRHGQGKTAGTERVATAVVGVAGLTTSDPDGTPAPGRHHNRRDCPPHPINAVVVRTWHGRDDGPGGQTVFLTNAAVEQPLQPFDDDEDRRLLEHGSLTERTQPWRWQHPPQQTARAVRGHVLFTWLMCALATAYRRPCAPVDPGGEPLGWQRGRRQLLERTRDDVIVFAQACDGSCPRAESSWLVGVKRKEVPPGLGPRQAILAT